MRTASPSVAHGFFLRTPLRPSVRRGDWRVLVSIAPVRPAGSFKAVPLSDADPSLVNLVTRMADAQYPSGYPSCVDLIEVTAQLATPPSFAPQLPPTDLYDPVNFCGPFTVRWLSGSEAAGEGY